MSLQDLKLDLIKNFNLSASDFRFLGNILILEKYNFDYEQMLSIQNQCVEHVLSNRRDIVLIFCSHPKIFTMGRGLQKIRDNELIELIEFDPNLKNELKFSVIDIKRGGGLTFHHEGQFVFYPILNTTSYNLKVHDLMIEILSMTSDSLIKMLPSLDLLVRKDLLGLWSKNDFFPQKIASIGLAVNRFVTYHGLALNFYLDTEMKAEIMKVYPCGISGELYTSVSELAEVHENSLIEFQNIFMNKFRAMLERQDCLIRDL